MRNIRAITWACAHWMFGAAQARSGIPRMLTSSDFVATNAAGGADISQVCFGAGTLIRTPRGDIEVEALTVGDEVMTYRGERRPIAWIGVGKVLATRGRRTAATPVIVRKGALADNVPFRDLRITKGHSLYIDGVLIPVEFLINHRSIVWDDRTQEVSIFHVELDSHDILIADGAPAESYRDDGNRWLFQNANSGWPLPPKEACAPVLTGGNVVDVVWHRLLDRAGPRKHVPLTDDPDLHLLIDGRRANAMARLGQAYVFPLSVVPADLHVVSRAAVPAELGLARDFRSLGVALRRIVVRKGMRFRTIYASGAQLSEGFHTFEPDNGFRWTDGDAAVPAELFAGFSAPLEVVVHVGATTRYLDEGRIVRAG
jgi:Hint domain